MSSDAPETMPTPAPIKEAFQSRDILGCVLSHFLEDACGHDAEQDSWSKPASEWWRVPALVSFGSINRTALETARPLLYRDVRLRQAGLDRGPLLFDTLRAAPDCGEFVLNLSVEAHSAGPKLTSRVIDACPNLRRLSLVNADAIAFCLRSVPDLDELRLMRDPQKVDTIAVVMTSRLHNLILRTNTVRLSDVHLQRPDHEASPSQTQQICRLRKLLLCKVMADSAVFLDILPAWRDSITHMGFHAGLERDSITHMGFHAGLRSLPNSETMVALLARHITDMTVTVWTPPQAFPMRLTDLQDLQSLQLICARTGVLHGIRLPVHLRQLSILFAYHDDAIMDLLEMLLEDDAMPMLTRIPRIYRTRNGIQSVAPHAYYDLKQQVLTKLGSRGLAVDKSNLGGHSKMQIWEMVPNGEDIAVGPWDSLGPQGPQGGQPWPNNGGAWGNAGGAHNGQWGEGVGGGGNDAAWGGGGGNGAWGTSNDLSTAMISMWEDNFGWMQE